MSSTQRKTCVRALIDLAIIAAMTIIAFVAAARLFKWRED
jgi:hypothetical protein